MTSNPPTAKKDLIVLLADKDAELTMQGLLTSPERLGIRPVAFELIVDRQGKDPGVYRKCDDILRSSLWLCDYALVVLDREGCGRSEKREVLEKQIEGRLAQNGWSDRCAAVVIDPELEAWVWTESPHVCDVLGWSSTMSELKRTLEEVGYLKGGHVKPHQPKAAFNQILRLSQKRRSSALFLELAQKVSFEGCRDPAFVKLKETLQNWFAI